MSSGYFNSGGFDFDDLFQPGTTQAPGFQRSDGTPLQYAARGSVPKIPDVGFRDMSDVDLSNLWMPKNSTPPVPGFDGQSYTADAQALTDATGTTSGTIQLTMRSDGTWTVTRILVNSIGSGTTVLASGTWLPAGASVSEFTVQYGVNAGSGQGSVTNGAATPQTLTASRSITLSTSVAAASADNKSDTRALTTTLTRVGGGSAVAHTNLTAAATGWF